MKLSRPIAAGFFLAEINKAYAALRQDSKAWTQLKKERAVWEATLQDGLEPAEIKFFIRKFSAI
jgi:hypothetical protein